MGQTEYARKKMPYFRPKSSFMFYMVILGFHFKSSWVYLFFGTFDGHLVSVNSYVNWCDHDIRNYSKITGKNLWLQQLEQIFRPTSRQWKGKVTVAVLVACWGRDNTSHTLTDREIPQFTYSRTSKRFLQDPNPPTNYR